MRKSIFETTESLLKGIDEFFDDTRDPYRMGNERVIERNLLYYCMAEGTGIPLLDGTTVPIENLMGKDPVWVYGFDLEKLKIAPVKLENCRQVGEKECVEVVLDSGESFVCTGDHRILTWFGYQEAGKLTEGTPLVPFKSKFFKAVGGRSGIGGYNQILQPYDAKWVQTHRAVYDYLYGIYDKKNVIHHENGIKIDNRPENLVLMSAKDHSTLTLIKHKTKIMKGLRDYCKTEISSTRKSASAIRQWADNREGMLACVRKGHQEHQEKRIAAIKTYWANPENKASETTRRLGNKWAQKGAAINCRVISVNNVGIKKVYDASVPATNNFAIEAGVFVHNCGFQHLEYMRSSKSFRVNPQYQYTPKPVSNEIREYVRSIKAMLMNQKMVPRIWPNTNEKEDELAADVGENVLTWMDQSSDGEFFDEKEENIILLCLSGTTFMRAYPDVDGGKWFIDENGELLKTGDVRCETLLPFNVRFDRLGKRLRDKRWVGVKTLKPREWVEDTFKVKVEKAGKDSPILDYERRIAGLVASVSAFNENAAGTSILSPEDDDAVLFREVEFKPQADYPFGRYVISAGGKILKIYQRLPIKSTVDQWYYSLTDFHFNYVPGRFWSDPPVNDLISPQNIINEIDQALIINRKGIGRPRIITAGDIGLKKLDMGGQGFLAMTYNPIMGQTPKIDGGTPLPVQVLEERRLQKEQMQELGGDPKNVLRGQQPSANASGILTQNLRETVEQGKAPDLDRFNRSLTRVYKKRMILAQEIFTEERLIKVTGRGNKVKITKFKASDLRGNTDVRLELDSGLITTKSGQAQMLVNLVQAGFFKDKDTPPAVQQEILQRMGMTSFTDETNADIERAEMENVAVATGTGEVMTAKVNQQTGKQEVVTDDPLFKYDNHAAHYETHRKFIISPEFKEVPFEKMAVLIYHADLHKQQIEETPPNIKDFVQIDKLLAPGVLTQSERAQVLQKDLGITPGNETEAGLPTADVVVKSKEKMIQTDQKEALKREQMMINVDQKDKQMNMDMVKHGITEAVKATAIQKSEQVKKNAL